MRYEFPLSPTFRGDILVGDEIPPQRFGDGTIVYWTMKGPRAACPPDVQEVHPDDEDFCRARGHYRAATVAHHREEGLALAAIPGMGDAEKESTP